MKKTIEIFRAGRHTPMSGAAIDFSEADLAEIAASYNPARHEAPVVVGHPSVDAPAYGWIKGLSAAGEHLFAELDQVDPQFSELVDAGRYKKVSASFYGRKSPANPTPGRYHLKHVGFLGAVPPAVKGLRQISFAEDAESLEFGETDPAAIDSPEGSGGGAAPGAPAQAPQPAQGAPAPAPAVATPDPKVPLAPENARDAGPGDGRPLSEASPDPASDLAARMAELEAKAKALEAREAALVKAEAARKAAEHVAFAESLVRQGRLLPRDRAGVAALLGALPEADLEFAEAGVTQKQTPAALLRDLLSRAPVQIDFSERAPSTAYDAPISPQAIHDAALAFCESERQAGRTITLEDAIYRVTETTR